MRRYLNTPPVKYMKVKHTTLVQLCATTSESGCNSLLRRGRRGMLGSVDAGDNSAEEERKEEEEARERIKGQIDGQAAAETGLRCIMM